MAPTIEHHGGHSWTPANQRRDQVPGRSQRLLLEYNNSFHWFFANTLEKQCYGSLWKRLWRMFDISYCDVIYNIIYVILLALRQKSHKPPFRLGHLRYFWNICNICLDATTWTSFIYALFWYFFESNTNVVEIPWTQLQLPMLARLIGLVIYKRDSLSTAFPFFIYLLFQCIAASLLNTMRRTSILWVNLG